MPDGSSFPVERLGAAVSLVAGDEILLRIGEVEQRVGLSRSTIYKRMAEGTFPAAVALGGGTVRWRRSEILAWQHGLPAREAAPPRPAPILPAATPEVLQVRRRGRPKKPSPPGQPQQG